MRRRSIHKTSECTHKCVQRRQWWQVAASISMNDYIIPSHNRIPLPQEEDEEEQRSSGSSYLKWRGNWVSEEEAKALRHVFDHLQDHFGHQRPDPMVRFNLSSRILHPRNGNAHDGDLDLNFTYDIDGQACNLAYIGIDVCIDLTPKLLHKYGQPMMKGYGKTWVYAYMPEPTWDKIKSYVKVGTGWNVSDEGTGIVHDPNRNLVAIEAKMHHQSEQPKPSFWAISDKVASGSDVSFSRIGSVQEVYEADEQQPSQQHMHRCVGMFAVSLDPSIKSTPATGGEASFSFTLVSIRTWGTTDHVAPIVHSPRK